MGCFKTGAVFKSPSQRWYEPQHELIGGKEYFAHCWGSMYALSGRAAEDISLMREGSLRFFANEGKVVWLL